MNDIRVAELETEVDLTTKRTTMRVNVFGLGYVGCVSAACLADSGCQVTGIDVDANKVQAINSGSSPIVESGIEALVQRAVNSKRLQASTQLPPRDADVSIICVGTPSNENGSLNLTAIEIVAGQVGEYLKGLNSYHVVNVRSTVLPGTVENRIIPILEDRSGKKAGRDFGVCMNPEFMREGSSIEDFYRPPFTVIGELDARSGDRIEALYKDVNAPVQRTTIRTAEMVKYACNSFHAVKVTFANEVGNICKTMGIDSHEVMRILCADTKLNLSSYYLKPGFAFGGSCLPKDLRALLYRAHQLDVETTLLSSILPSNKNQVEQAFKLIAHTGLKKVGVLGLSFKRGTDDLRESPMVALIERLIGKGYSVRIYDEEVLLSRVVGSNKQYIEGAIPHISCLMKNSIEAVVDHSEVVVVGKAYRSWLPICERLSKEVVVVDLIRSQANTKGLTNYHGICW